MITNMQLITSNTMNVRCVIGNTKCCDVVKLDNLSVVRQPKRMTDKYEILQELCEAFDDFSESERKLNLFKYLGFFSRRDAIPGQYYENPGYLESLFKLKLYLNKNFYVIE